MRLTAPQRPLHWPERRLRLGIDASMLEPVRTGVGNYVFNLLQQYQRLAAPAELYLFSDRAISEDARAFGHCIEHIGPPLKKGPLWMTTGLVPLLRRYRIGVFWGGNGYLPLVVPRSVRRVITVHDLVYLRASTTTPFISRWSRRILQPLSIRVADVVICVSQSTARDVHAEYGRHADAILEPQIHPAYRRVSEDEIRGLRTRYQLPERFLLTIGTVEPRKNLATLLRAYTNVQRMCGTLPMLVMAGKPGWLSHDVEQLARQAEAAGIVRALGYVPLQDMPALYSAAEAFIFVPLYEGYGMPAREALLCGTPVIASDIPAMHEATAGLATFVSPDQASIECILETLARGALPLRRPSADALQNCASRAAAEQFAELIEQVGRVCR